MHDQYGWRTLTALCVLKLSATTISFVSGTPGGLFAPTLFMGAMLGGAVCAVERLIVPDVTGPIGAYALVGMGTLFAGILRAPITSVFMIVEVSGNYSIVLPVMISNTIAYLVSRQFQHAPLFDLLARQDGTELPSMEAEREAEIRLVEDAMRPVSSEVEEAMRPIVPPFLYPDQSLESALALLQQRPVVAVVHRADPTRLIGVLALDDVLRAYRDGQTINDNRRRPE